MIPKGTTIPPTTTDINRLTHRHRHRRHRLLASPAGIKLFVMFITSKPNYYVAHHLIDLFSAQLKDTYFPSNFATKSKQKK